MVTFKIVGGARAYIYNGVAFEFMTTAILFQVLVEAGDLKGAVEWKERYGL